MSVTCGRPSVRVPSLVEGDGRDLAERLQHGTSLEEQAPAGSVRQGRGDRRRGRDDERAGTADEQDREALVDPCRPDAAEGERRHDSDQSRDGDDGGRVDAREAVDEALRRRLALLRLLYQADDAGDCVVGGGRGDLDAQRAVAVDGAGEDVVAGGLAHGHALARHRRLVDAARAGEHDAVGRDPIARPNEDGPADLKAFRRHLDGPAVPLHERGARDEQAERPYPGTRPAGGDALEQLADQEQEDHGRPFLAGTDEDGADGGDRHQHLDREGRAVERCDHGAARDRNQPDEHGGVEDPRIPGWQEPAGHVGGQQGRAAGDRQTRLGRAPPRAARRPDPGRSQGGRNLLVKRVRMSVIVIVTSLRNGLVPVSVSLRDVSRRAGMSAAAGRRTGRFGLDAPDGGNRRDLEAEGLHLPLDGSQIAVGMDDRHRAAGNRHRDVFYAGDPAHGGVDLGGAGRAVHAVHAIAGSGRGGRHRSLPCISSRPGYIL